jgi:hypothetical protein
MFEAGVLEIFPLRYAFVGRDSTSPPDVLDTEWVGVFRETETDGSAHYRV